MHLTTVRTELYGKHILRIVQFESLTYVLHFLVQHLHTTELRDLLQWPGSSQYQWIDDVNTLMSTNDYPAVWGNHDRPLVINGILQTVTVIVASHQERPPVIFLTLGNDIGDTMLCDHPHAMMTVLHHTIDSRAYQP